MLVYRGEGDSPAAVGQSDGHGAVQQVAFGLTDDGLTVSSWSDDHKLSDAVPERGDTDTADHRYQFHRLLHFAIFPHLVHYRSVCILEAWFMLILHICLRQTICRLSTIVDISIPPNDVVLPRL